MSEINYQPVFDYINEHVEQRIDELREEIRSDIRTETDRVLTAISSFGSQTENNTQEIAVAHNRIDGVDAWITKVAEKTNTPYNP